MLRTALVGMDLLGVVLHRAAAAPGLYRVFHLVAVPLPAFGETCGGRLSLFVVHILLPLDVGVVVVTLALQQGVAA